MINRKSIRIIIVIITIAAGIIYTRDLLLSEYTRISGFTQGTSYNITYENRGKGNLKEEIEVLLDEFERSLSIYIPNSLISKINRDEPGVTADEYLVTVYNEARGVYEATDGAFDITVAPLVNAWGFGSSDKAESDSQLIDSLIRFVGMDMIRMEDKKIIKEHPETMLNVNAIAKGYSVDLVADLLDDKNIRNYLVEIGGEVRTKGKNKEGMIWRIGIDKPKDNNMIPGADMQAVITLDNKSLATSGNYRQFYEKDGKKYAHTIDPSTGYPALSNLLSSTVVAENCITADAYATAFMVMGLEKAKEFLSNNEKLDAYLIYSNDEGEHEVYFTPGIAVSIESL